MCSVASLLTERITIEEFLKRVHSQLVPFFINDLSSIIVNYIKPAFLLHNDLIHDLCLLRNEMLCDHKQAETEIHCMCSSHREWQYDHFLKSKYKTEEFKDLIVKFTKKTKQSKHFYVDWESLGDMCKVKFLHQQILPDPYFMLFYNDDTKRITYDLRKRNTLCDVLQSCHGLIYISMIHLTLFGPVIELKTTAIGYTIPLSSVHCINCEKGKGENMSPKERMKLDDEWIYCHICRGGPFCSIICRDKEDCEKHFSLLDNFIGENDE